MDLDKHLWAAGGVVVGAYLLWGRPGPGVARAIAAVIAPPPTGSPGSSTNVQQTAAMTLHPARAQNTPTPGTAAIEAIQPLVDPRSLLGSTIAQVLANASAQAQGASMALDSGVETLPPEVLTQGAVNVAQTVEPAARILAEGVATYGPDAVDAGLAFVLPDHPANLSPASVVSIVVMRLPAALGLVPTATSCPAAPALPPGTPATVTSDPIVTPEAMIPSPGTYQVGPGIYHIQTQGQITQLTVAAAAVVNVDQLGNVFCLTGGPVSVSTGLASAQLQALTTAGPLFQM